MGLERVVVELCECTRYGVGATFYGAARGYGTGAMLWCPNDVMDLREALRSRDEVPWRWGEVMGPERSAMVPERHVMEVREVLRG